MARPALTIGMAHFQDYHGVYFSIQALKMYHREMCKNIEIVVVDNSPNTNHGQHVRNLLAGFSSIFANVQYVAFTDSSGTTQTRQKVFDVATGRNVLCMDCHVLIELDGIERLLRYYAENPSCNDILSGPMMFDDIYTYATHFDLKWRAEMWGVWGQAFQCRSCDAMFSVYTPDNATSGTLCEFHNLLSFADEPACRCGDKRPTELPVQGHQAVLESMGYTRPGINVNDKPFEIPAMGLGLFSMRKAAWPGFNPDMRGFGGEEGYIHEKVRQQGGRAMCLPFLRWNHRFGRPDGGGYPLARFDKIRNAILTWNEIGFDLAPIRQHFVEENNLFSRREWDMLVADPINATEVATKRINTGGLPLPAYNPQGMGELLDWTRTQERDLNEHLDTLALYASKVTHATEISKRRESTVGLLAGLPKGGTLVSYQEERNDELLRVVAHEKATQAGIEWVVQTERPSNSLPIAKTGLLFIDDRHNYNTVSAQLALHAPAVDGFIILHDTVYHSRKGDDGGEGLAVAMRDFVRASDGKWFVARHDRNQYGLTVLSNRPEEFNGTIEPWPVGAGAGTELHAILASMGFHITPECTCRERIETMDRNGLAWCRANEKTIITWLREETDRRAAHPNATDAEKTAKKIFTRAGAWVLIKKAIWNAARKGLK